MGSVRSQKYHKGSSLIRNIFQREQLEWLNI